MIFLTDKQVKKIINMKEAIDIVEETFKCYSEGKAIVPNRTQIKLSQGKSTALYMPGYSENMQSLGIKIVTVFPDNVYYGRKTINALVVLSGTKTGEPIALIEANYLTALRTGAASGVATKYLSRENSKKISIIGAGYQAKTQLEAMCCVRNITDVLVYDISLKKAKEYIYSMKKQLSNNIVFKLASSSKEAIKDTDIICTTTYSKKPVFEPEYLKKGVHINAIGSFAPDMQEINEEVIVKADKICVDSIEAVLKEAGDLIIPINKGLINRQDVNCEIGDVAIGKKRGRENDSEITIFKTVGISILDIAVSMHIYKKAKQLKLGKKIN